MIALPADPNNGLAILAGGLGFVVGVPLVIAWIVGRERIQVWRTVRQIKRSRRKR